MGNLTDHLIHHYPQHAKDRDFMFYRALNLKNAGRDEEALELFDQLITMDPSQENYQIHQNRIQVRMGKEE